MIRKLTSYKFGQAVRDDGPDAPYPRPAHRPWAALILVSDCDPTLLWADLKNRYVWVALFTTAGFRRIGWVDDYRKVVHRNPKGLRPTKIFWQSAWSRWPWRGSLALYANLPAQTEMIVPFFKLVAIPLGTDGSCWPILSSSAPATR